MSLQTDDWVMLGVALLCAVVGSVLAAADAALQSMSRSRAERLVDEGRAGAQRVHSIAEDPAPYLNAALFVRTIVEICSVVLVTIVAARHVDRFWLQLLIAVGTMVVVSFILWGVAPRTLGRQRADGIALKLSGPVSFLEKILGPIPGLMILLGNALTPGRGFSDGPFSSEAELREMVDLAEATDLIEAGERKMIHSVFELGDTIVKEVMVPRTDVVWIQQNKTLRQALSLALRSGFSRIPVVADGGLDEVVGVVYLKDVTRRVFDNASAERNQTVAEIMRPVTFVPDSKPVDEVLRDLQRQRIHMVMVVDEFGGTAGLLSIEDIIEEIVGEIVDEYDAEPSHVEQIDDDSWRISARLSVDDLGELVGRDLDDEDVETVGGLMAKLLNMVPIQGSSVLWEGLEITAEKTAGRRHQIDTCVVRRLPEGYELEPRSDDDD